MMVSIELLQVATVASGKFELLLSLSPPDKLTPTILAFSSTVLLVRLIGFGYVGQHFHTQNSFFSV